MNDEEMVREALRMTEEQFGMKYPAAEMALDRISSRLQAAEADKTEWRDLYEELHVKLEAAEAENLRLADVIIGEMADRNIELADRCHELQEALERIVKEEGGYDGWKHKRTATNALHPTQNEGAP